MKRTHRFQPRHAGLILLAAGLLLPPDATDAQVPAPPQRQPIALTGATIHTVTQGVIDRGTLVFEDGVITAIGADVAIPDGARHIELTGRHLYPGLIHAHSQLGLYEIGAVDMTVDLNELGAFNPNARAQVAFHPESRHIGVARSNGVLVAVSSPAGGRIAGRSAAMMLDGWTWEDMAILPDAGLTVNWPSPFQERQYDDEVRSLRDFFASSRAYRDARRAAPGRHAADPRLEAMIAVVDGQIPVVVNASELRQIQDALAWAHQEGLRIILLGAHDAGFVADLLAARRVPVILTTVLDAPNRAWEPYDRRYSLPARLHQAGVTFAIAGAASAPYVNRLPYEAGAAMAFGLPADQALRAITINPATFLGMADRVGSLEVGKDATLIITTGSPLEYSTVVEQAYVQGRRIDMRDAHRQLFEKYTEKVRQAAERLPPAPPSR